MKNTRFSDKEYIEYLNESRESFFWNEKQFELILKHIGWNTIDSFLDVGCGLGYLTFMMVKFLDRECDILGIDIDPKLIEIANRKENKYNLSNITFETGDIYALKAPNNSFDFIAEQLTLSHLAKPEGAIKELFRVLKPGGFLLLIEPNNLAMSVVDNSITRNLKIEERLAILSLEMKVQQGKIKLGEGDDNFGDHALELLVKGNMKILDVRLCDKLSPAYPPYNLTGKEKLLQFVKNELSPYWKKLFKRYYIAGGGSSREFEEIWAIKKRVTKEIERAIIDDSYYDIRAGFLYSYLSKKTG